MKKLLLACSLVVSVFSWAAEQSPTTPSAADIPGTLVPPTQKQLKSIKKPKKEKAPQPIDTTSPTTTPSH